MDIDSILHRCQWSHILWEPFGIASYFIEEEFEKDEI